MKDNEQKNNSNIDLEKFAEIISKRDETRDDRLSTEIANLTRQVSKLVTITALSEQQHRQHREERDKTDETLKNHGKRIYVMEKQILELEVTDKFEQKKSDNFDKIKIGVMVLVFTALILAYFEVNKKQELINHPTSIGRPFKS